MFTVWLCIYGEHSVYLTCILQLLVWIAFAKRLMLWLHYFKPLIGVTQPEGVKTFFFFKQVVIILLCITHIANTESISRMEAYDVNSTKYSIHVMLINNHTCTLEIQKHIHLKLRNSDGFDKFFSAIPPTRSKGFYCKCRVHYSSTGLWC